MYFIVRFLNIISRRTFYW